MESDEILTSSRAQRVGQELEKSKTKKKKEIIRQVLHDGFFFFSNHITPEELRARSRQPLIPQHEPRAGVHFLKSPHSVTQLLSRLRGSVWRLPPVGFKYLVYFVCVFLKSPIE